uniref:RNA-directed DNA polymerase, eukaryota, reverse transcriptase zinc-binding domain protein n=1 Tax=Tanacetum cinerariifolium TaxID=118510 RepID=A0A6L2LL02_TANCI|nr:RNA-directed DNA polymerase, eukaryota, reverse transcriptase zinc-binding domain protein [Tanacetum cinerariifolium]
MNRKDSLYFFGELDRMEAKDLAQKAKIKWAPEGDENTSFFHGTLKKKGLHAFTCKANELGYFKGAFIGWDNMNILHLMRYSRGGVESSQFDALQAAIENVALLDQCDSWKWSLDVSVGYSIVPLRTLVDAHTLDVDIVATRLNR